MTTLADILLAPGRREALVRKTATWVERHVERTSGLRGMALKTGLSAVRSARPDAVERTVDRLLPEFARALEPMFADFRAGGGRDFGAYLAQHRDEATGALMAVADARAAASSHRALAAGYRRLRGTLESELRGLLPEIARMMAAELR
jgi:hypothetical protein